jgi:hypothetical protein
LDECRAKTFKRKTMKTPQFRSLICAISLATLSLGPALRADQPRMNEAIAELEMAKTAHKGNHIDHLENARRMLVAATPNKGGERMEAIQNIDRAIEAARKHEGQRMEELIDRAMTDVRQGKFEARGDRPHRP